MNTENSFWDILWHITRLLLNLIGYVCYAILRFASVILEALAELLKAILSK